MVGTRRKNSNINTEESSSHSNFILSEEEMRDVKLNVIMTVLLETLQELLSSVNN